MFQFHNSKSFFKTRRTTIRSATCAERLVGWRHNTSDHTHARTHTQVYTDLQENVCEYAGRSTNTVQTRTRCPLYRVHENCTARRTEAESTSQYKKKLLYKQRSFEAGLRVTAFRRLKEVLTVSTLSPVIRTPSLWRPTPVLAQYGPIGSSNCHSGGAFCCH